MAVLVVINKYLSIVGLDLASGSSGDWSLSGLSNPLVAPPNAARDRSPVRDHWPQAQMPPAQGYSVGTDRTTEVRGRMTFRSKTDQPGEPVPAHSDEVFEVPKRILGASPARSRHVEIRSGRRVHFFESGEGPPVLFLPGF